MVSNAYWKPFNRPDSGIFIDLIRGEGIYLYDQYGKKYIDANSGLWNVNFGYDDEEIKEAIKKQLNELPYVNPILIDNKKARELSSLLCNITHKEISKVAYTCSGSEAIDYIIKIARKYSSLKGSNKINIGVIENSYHGSYYGSMSASCYEEEEKEGYGPMVQGFIKFKFPFCRCCKNDNLSVECKEKMIRDLKSELDMYGKDLCAIIVEPVIASGGVIDIFEEYMLTLYDYCKRNDILFACDEVATGFGRTGEMFRFQKYNIYPDLIALSKGINNGYLPFGAVCISEKIENEFIKNKEIIFHLSTQNANPICVSSSLATINKLLDKNVLDNINYISKYSKTIFKRLLGRFECVFDIRIVGLMIAIDLIDKTTGEVLEKNKLNKVLERVYIRGCLVCSSYVENKISAILIFPQFISSKQDIDIIAKLIKESLMEIEVD